MTMDGRAAAHVELEPIPDGAVIVRKYRFRSSARLTAYVRDMQEEYAWLVNAGVEGCMALDGRRPERAIYDLICRPSDHDTTPYHDSMTCGTHSIYVGTPRAKKHLGIKATVTIPTAWAHGAIKDGTSRVATGGSYRPRGRGSGRMISMLSSTPLGTKSREDMVYLPSCAEPFRLRESLKDDVGRMTTYRIVDVTAYGEDPPDSERKFELHCTYRCDVTPHMGTETVAGVNPGGRYTAAVSYLRNGEDVGGQLVQISFGPERQRLRNLHRQLSRCKKGSRKHGELTRQIRKIHQKIERKWNHAAHQHANHIVRNADAVFAKGSDFAVMGSRDGNNKRQVRRSLKYAKPGEFRDMILYKAQRAGKTYREIRPADTSKRCSLCEGYDTVRKGDILQCKSCGAEAHAYLNAGSNIASGDFDIIEWSKRARNAGEFEAALQVARNEALRGMGAVPAPDGPTPEGAPHDHTGEPRHPAPNVRQPEAPPGHPACAVGSCTPLKGNTKPPDGREVAPGRMQAPDISQPAARASSESPVSHAHWCGG